jgi:hypothetical protein
VLLLCSVDEVEDFEHIHGIGWGEAGHGYSSKITSLLQALA